MRTHSICALLVALFAVTAFGCDVETPTEPPNQPNEPNSNGQVITQRLIGHVDRRSALYDGFRNSNGNWIFRGLYNYYYAIGELHDDGSPEWFSLTGYWPAGVLESANLRGVDEQAIVAIGPFDSNLDGNNDYSKVSVFRAEGDLVSQSALNRHESRSSLLSICESQGSLLAAGATVIDGTTYPYIATVDVGPNGATQIVSETVFESQPAVTIRDIVVNTSPSSKLCSHYASGYRYDGKDRSTLVVIGLREEADGPFTVVWSVNVIAEPGRNTTIGGGALRTRDGTVYVSGRADVTKDPSPGNGGYWNVGLVAAISSDGAVQWVRTPKLSAYAEGYNGLDLTDDYLYAVGFYSRFVKCDSGKEYGYGLISRFRLSDGVGESHMSLGDQERAAGFVGVRIEGSSAVCFGWKNTDEKGDSYRGWFAKVNLPALNDTSLHLVDSKARTNAGIAQGHMSPNGDHGVSMH